MERNWKIKLAFQKYSFQVSSTKLSWKASQTNPVSSLQETLLSLQGIRAPTNYLAYFKVSVFWFLVETTNSAREVPPSYALLLLSFSAIPILCQHWWGSAEEEIPKPPGMTMHCLNNHLTFLLTTGKQI